MNKLLKKVDRIKSVQEAVELQYLGVDLIGVSLNQDMRFSDDRCINMDLVINVKKELTSAKLVGEIIVGKDFTQTLSLIDEINFDYVQVTENLIPPIEFRRELIKRQVGIIYAGIEATYDDDPSWILSGFKNKSELNEAFFQIDLLGNIKNSWDSFCRESPQYPEELQIDDIEEIGKEFPLFIALDYNENNVLEIINRLPSIKGISMVLGKCTNICNIHCFEYASVIEVMGKLKI